MYTLQHMGPHYRIQPGSTSGQTFDAWLEQLLAAGCEPVFKETMSGARNDRPGLKKALVVLPEGEGLDATHLHRLFPAQAKID